MNRRFQAKQTKYCHRNYCIDFNQIWHNIRDHHVVIVGGPNKRPTSPKWQTAAIFKTVNLLYICNRLTDFDEIWHGDACWCPERDVKFKVLIFYNIIWQVAAMWRIEKLL